MDLHISEIISDYTSSSKGFATLRSLIMNSFMKKERKLFIKEHEDEQYYYAILGVLEDRNREMLSVVNPPTEEVMYWKEEFEG